MMTSTRKSILSHITFGRVAAVLTLVGALSLSYVAGAAVMYFRLPTSDFLWNAFSGAGDVSDPSKPDTWEPGNGGKTLVPTHKAGASTNEFLLVTESAAGVARLVDMDGHVAHSWKMAAPRTWTKAPHARDTKSGDSFHFERCVLYPNGDVLALCASGQEAPYGYALVKLDKDSKLLWAYSGNVHHDVTVGEDGLIYVLGDRLTKRPPDSGDLFPKEFLGESLIILKPDGEHLKTIPLGDKFQSSDYALTLFSGPGFGASTTVGMPGLPPGLMTSPGSTPGQPAAPLTPAGAIPDPFHANSVKVLSADMAAKFPLFKAGQILISLRNPSALVVVDPESGTVVWAAKGPWLYQHDAQFLSTGKLLLFDNSGSPQGSRVLEYDPMTQAVTWYYGGDRATGLNVPLSGSCQRLANGNTLVVDAYLCRVIEVNSAREIVWEWSGKIAAKGFSPTGMFSYARRYPAAEVKFLK